MREGGAVGPSGRRRGSPPIIRRAFVEGALGVVAALVDALRSPPIIRRAFVEG